MIKNDASSSRLLSLCRRKPRSLEDLLDFERLDKLSSQLALAHADLMRPKIGLLSIPRDEHTRIRLRARARVKSLPAPRLAYGADETGEN